MRSYSAAEKIKKRGRYELVGQMMTALPLSTRQDELDTAGGICDMGCDAARIYPTVVLGSTELCEMAERGEYIPSSVERAVEDAAAVCEVFLKRGVRTIRVGLSAADNLDESTVYGGGYHEALGEMVAGRMYLTRLEGLFDGKEDSIKNKTVSVGIPPRAVSKVLGHRGKNRKILCEKYGIARLNLTEDPGLCEYELRLLDIK